MTDPIVSIPIDATLLVTERNALLPRLEKHGFDPAAFSWESVTTDESEHSSDDHHPKRQFLASSLVHKASSYYFTFGGYVTIRSPGTTRTVAEDLHNKNWQTKLARFETWLGRLRDEIAAPDLWLAVGSERVLSAGAESLSANEPFNTAEQITIAERLTQLEQFVVESRHLQNDEAKYVQEQFTYLRESSKRLGRKDWLNIVVGNLFSQAIQLALPPESARGLLQLAGNVFRFLWDHAQHLLPS